MEKVEFTPHQQSVLTEISKNKFIKENFYFTGGTALAIFYLNHRKSEDLDFFATEKFNKENVVSFIAVTTNKLKCKSTLNEVFGKMVFNLTFERKLSLKVEFNYYPYKRLNRGKNYKGVLVDSLFDIGVNKMMILNQRKEVKDYVDLYFLLQEVPFWDLYHGVTEKFKIKLDIVNLASDLIFVENFDYLPDMIKTLELEKLKEFFKKKALSITERVTE